MRHAEWYFDVISPFAYLQCTLLPSLSDVLNITYRPVLFAGLLNHWGQLGPAEIPHKRLHTYRFCAWWAGRNGIPFTMPPSHPFNPLHVLRLLVALDGDAQAVRTVFEAIYGEGRDVNAPDSWRALGRKLGCSDADSMVADPAVKDRLRRNTEVASKRGVFGVPTIAIDGELFWGLDATDMVRDFMSDDGLLQGNEMARYADLPVTAQRRRPT